MFHQPASQRVLQSPELLSLIFGFLAHTPGGSEDEEEQLGVGLAALKADARAGVVHIVAKEAAVVVADVRVDAGDLVGRELAVGLLAGRRAAELLGGATVEDAVHLRVVHDERASKIDIDRALTKVPKSYVAPQFRGLLVDSYWTRSIVPSEWISIE